LPSPNVNGTDTIDQFRVKVNNHFNDSNEHGGGSGAQAAQFPFHFSEDDTELVMLQVGGTLTAFRKEGSGSLTITLRKLMALPNESDFNTGWVKNNTPTVTSNSTTDPDGTTLADTITPSATSSNIAANLGLASGTVSDRTFRFVMYLKADVAHNARFVISSTATSGGAVAATAVDQVVAVTTGWQHFSAQGTFGSGRTETFVKYRLFADNATTNLVYAFGARAYEVVTLVNANKPTGLPATYATGDILSRVATGVVNPLFGSIG
jgi:hypothetical protein